MGTTGVVDTDQSVLGLTAMTPVTPQTPHESMEFLSRSWSISATEISKVILGSNKLAAKSMLSLPRGNIAETAVDRHFHGENGSRKHSTGRKILNKDDNNSSAKKERDRIDRAQVHAAVSVAGVAAAIAAVVAEWNTRTNSPDLLITDAMASATELIASHVIDVAEQAGAEHDKVVSVVSSAVDVKTNGDLMTLTAAAATSLRAAAALKHSRLHKEEDLGIEMINPDFFCKEGLLLKRTKGGALHWKKVTVFINKNSQVIVKLKSKHVGGAFSKRESCVVCGVYEDIPAWPAKAGRSIGAHFGLRTPQGIIEFECENQILKQTWVDVVRNLLHQVEKL